MNVNLLFSLRNNIIVCLYFFLSVVYFKVIFELIIVSDIY